MKDIETTYELIRKHGPAIQKTFEMISVAALSLAEGMRLLSESFEEVDASESEPPAEAATRAPSTVPPVDEPDDRVVLRYLRGLVGHDGAATLPMISDGTNLSLVRTSDALDYLLSRTLARSFVNGNARFFAPTKWSDDDKRHLDPPEGNEIAAVVRSVASPPDPASDDVPPDYVGGIGGEDAAAIVPVSRRKESPRTCTEWASDDVSWKAYVASCARAADDHPAKKYNAAQLEDMRVKFREAMADDYGVFARPGAKFTRWLETRS
jgi:hypothetical protein